MYYQTPSSSVILFFMMMIMESPKEIINSTISISYFCHFLIFLTCLISFFLNYSTYYLVGKSSSLTYNIISHSKKVVLFLSGVFIFGDVYDFLQILGILVATSGLFLYSYSGNLRTKDMVLPYNKILNV